MTGTARRPLVALCLGHSRLVNARLDGGAVSVGGVSEHAYWSGTVAAIAAALAAAGVSTAIIDFYEGRGYSAAMGWLAGRIRKLGADCAVELHFNSSDRPAAGGHEWLYWSMSIRARNLAERLREVVAGQFPELPDRGIKPIRNADRGAEFLKLTPCPAVICEPFFGSNEEDWRMATGRKQDLACAIAGGIAKWLSSARL